MVVEVTYDGPYQRGDEIPQPASLLMGMNLADHGEADAQTGPSPGPDIGAEGARRRQRRKNTSRGRRRR
jgi:hypothetical protein